MMGMGWLVFLFTPFPHTPHVVDEEMACTDCHEATTSTSAEDLLVPGRDLCLDCHEEEDIEFYQPQARELWIAVFSHKKHVNLADLRTCTACHADSTHPVLPRMEGCATCHDDAHASASCQTCHAREDRRLVFYHPSNWRAFHGMEARASSRACLMCHRPTMDPHPAGTCLDCHEGDNLRYTVHPPQYRWAHAQDVNLRNQACETCHAGFADCQSCHRHEASIPQDHLLPSWKEDVHGMEARLYPDRCIICHNTGEITCARCHR